MLRPSHPRSRAALQTIESSESWRTIIIALLANVVIAVAKLISGLMSGSIAMIAEAAHSLADASNEVLLGISLRRAGAPPDEQHPLGHGRERFLWAFLAALASFLVGGCFSVAIAIRELLHPEPMKSPVAAWIVLAIAFLADGFSLVQSIRQAHSDAKRRGRNSIWFHLWRTSDPTVRAVVVEDSAALIGLVIAAIGLLLTGYTGSGKPDAIASLVIGILLMITAFALARPLADFLVGKSLPPELVAELHQLIKSNDAVKEVVALQAVYIGPEEVIVAAKVRPDPNVSTADLTQAMDRLDRALRETSPFVADVYIDVTSRHEA